MNTEPEPAKIQENPKLQGQYRGLKPFQPGVSGNPAGRPRKRPQSEANDELLRSEVPEIMRTSMNKGMGKEVLAKGATWADAIAYGLARKAVAGDSAAAKELRESVEGKSVQRVELTSPEDKGFEVKVSFEMPASPRIEKRIASVVEEKIIEAVTAKELEDEESAK